MELRIRAMKSDKLCVCLIKVNEHNFYAKNLMKTLSNNPSENRVKTLWKDMHLMIAQMDIWKDKAQ